MAMCHSNSSAARGSSRWSQGHQQGKEKEQQEITDEDESDVQMYERQTGIPWIQQQQKKAYHQQRKYIKEQRQRAAGSKGVYRDTSLCLGCALQFLTHLPFEEKAAAATAAEAAAEAAAAAGVSDVCTASPLFLSDALGGAAAARESTNKTHAGGSSAGAPYERENLASGDFVAAGAAADLLCIQSVDLSVLDSHHHHCQQEFLRATASTTGGRRAARRESNTVTISGAACVEAELLMLAAAAEAKRKGQHLTQEQQQELLLQHLALPLMIRPPVATPVVNKQQTSLPAASFHTYPRKDQHIFHTSTSLETLRFVLSSNSSCCFCFSQLDDVSVNIPVIRHDISSRGKNSSSSTSASASRSSLLSPPAAGTRSLLMSFAGGRSSLKPSGSDVPSLFFLPPPPPPVSSSFCFSSSASQRPPAASRFAAIALHGNRSGSGEVFSALDKREGAEWLRFASGCGQQHSPILADREKRTQSRVAALFIKSRSLHARRMQGSSRRSYSSKWNTRRERDTAYPRIYMWDDPLICSRTEKSQEQQQVLMHARDDIGRRQRASKRLSLLLGQLQQHLPKKKKQQLLLQDGRNSQQIPHTQVYAACLQQQQLQQQQLQQQQLQQQQLSQQQQDEKREKSLHASFLLPASGSAIRHSINLLPLPEEEKEEEQQLSHSTATPTALKQRGVRFAVSSPRLSAMQRNLLATADVQQTQQQQQQKQLPQQQEKSRGVIQTVKERKKPLRWWRQHYRRTSLLRRRGIFPAAAESLNVQQQNDIQSFPCTFASSSSCGIPATAASREDKEEIEKITTRRRTEHLPPLSSTTAATRGAAATRGSAGLIGPGSTAASTWYHASANMQRHNEVRGKIYIGRSLWDAFDVVSDWPEAATGDATAAAAARRAAVATRAAGAGATRTAAAAAAKAAEAATRTAGATRRAASAATGSEDGSGSSAANGDVEASKEIVTSAGTEEEEAAAAAATAATGRATAATTAEATTAATAAIGVETETGFEAAGEDMEKDNLLRLHARMLVLQEQEWLHPVLRTRRRTAAATAKEDNISAAATISSSARGVAITTTGKKKKPRGVSYAQFLFPSRFEYDPYAVDNKRFQQGKHQTVLRMQAFSTSVIPYYPPLLLKDELNNQFHKLHPTIHPSMTLSKLRNLKRKMFLLLEREEQLDVSTVACAWVYFERLVLLGVVQKSCRKLYAGACLLLAFKFHQNGEREIVRSLGKLLKQMDRSASPQPLCLAEFTVYCMLEFSLQLSLHHVLPLILSYLEDKDETFEDVYGSPETAFFSV